MLDKYRDYFDIDPEYFPQINEKVINNNPDIWKKFYPHETFVKLLKDTVSVLTRKQKVSVWVEGAYGTGKSHAVLTLKKLLEASPEDTKAYFDKYPDQLSNDLYNQFQQLKTGEQKILTVHRYGSSKIHGDDSLVFAIQESIQHALKENGMDTTEAALKDSVIQWINDPLNKDFFNSLLAGPYRPIFGGADADAVIANLKSFTGDSLIELMSKITKVAEERHLQMLQLDADHLTAWIEAVIQENNLKAIMFIWDEFTEYFRNNMRSLTGFQRIVDLSSSAPFYMLIVTHDAMHIFPDGDKEFGKIKGRFIDPICEISLPDNMAFRLMGSAMTKKEDPQILKEWEETVDELCDRTKGSRKLVMQKAKISDKELQSILPIHPHTALLLKHISATFDSNQRSMFDFIKNDRGDELKGFQWYIDNYGPFDTNPLLTIDELWDFFYEKGKEYLAHDIRSILDYYNAVKDQNLSSDHRRVLKAVLLMQAISQKVGSSVDLFVPNVENIDHAFEGSDLDQGLAGRLATEMDREKILYQQPIGGGKYQFAARMSVTDDSVIEELKDQMRKKTTIELVEQGEISEAITLTGALKARFHLECASASDLKSKANRLRNLESSLGNKLMAIMTFARDDKESVAIGKMIDELLKDDSYHITFIDASITPLGNDLLEQYANAMANATYQKGKDNDLSRQYERDAKDVLKKWRQRIENGEYRIYSKQKPAGERATTQAALYAELTLINSNIYPLSLETGSAVPSSMWDLNAVKFGVEAAVAEDTTKKGVFSSSNPNTKLENFIGEDAWKHPNYWVDKPYLLISKIKIEVEKIIADEFKKNGRVSIRQIYSVLMDKPYGFMPCNLSVFVLAFVLKEYAVSSFTYTDGLTNDVMSTDKLRLMIDEVIKLQNTPNPRYKDKFIVTMTPEERKFSDVASDVFGIQRNLCTSIEQTRERIRDKMKGLSFPIWCLKYILDTENLKTEKDIMVELIDGFSDIANSGAASKKTDSDIAISIGALCIEHEDASDDLKSILSSAKCKEGMDAYLHQFEDGELVKLAEIVSDNGQYINRLRKKFDADAANWVWNKETADQKIREVILEYRIIVESNKVNPRALTFDNAVQEWCTKCKTIRMSYLCAENYWNDLKGFMSQLYNIKKSGSLPESQRENFLNQLTLHANDFVSYCSNQIEIFKQACSFYLSEFTDDEIRDLYQAIKGNDVFTMERSDYVNLVKQTVKEFKLTRKSMQLRKLWSEKTGTESPKKWSEQFKTPILCMVPETEIEQARAAFDTLNRNQPDAGSIDKALEYLESAGFYDSLKDGKARDAAFKRCIIKNYDVILTDLDDVRDYLVRTVGSPYSWLGLPSVETKLKEMAQAKYDETGCDTALEKIDSMDVEDVKRYLKQLIRGNMTVGIEIIKDN